MVQCSDSCTGYFFYHGATVSVGQGLLIIEDSWSHSDTSQSVGLFSTSDHPDAETSTWKKHNTHKGPTSTPHAGFESTIPASERPQTHALDCAMPRLLPNGNIRWCPFSRRLYGPRTKLRAVEMRKISANTRNRLKSQHFRADCLCTFPTRLSRVLLVHRACNGAVSATGVCGVSSDSIGDSYYR